MNILRKYTPVASDLPPTEVSAAWRSSKSSEECLGEIGSYLKVRHLFPVSTGRAALYAILKAALPPGSKVVLPGYTCYTVAAAVIRAGMRPVLSDSRKDDLGYDSEKLSETIRSHPDIRAVVVCHLFGIALDINEIREIVGPEILIIDDAAQGYGLKVKGRFLGTGGDAGFYSFGRGKNLSIVGGGLLVTDDDNLAGKIAALIKSEFKEATDSVSGYIKARSYNLVTRASIFGILSRLPGMKLGRSVFDPDFEIARLSDFKIRLLHRICKTAEKMNAERLDLSMQYLSILGDNPSVAIPKSQMDGQPGSLRLPVLIADTGKRREVLRIGDCRGLGLSTMYPTALNGVEALPERMTYNLDGAEAIAESIVTLPTHHRIKSGGRDLIKKIAGLFE